MLMRAWIIVALLWGLPLAPVHASEADDLLTQLKVAYIYNFTRFIRWPATTSDRPFVVGVIGDAGIRKQFATLERDGRLAEGRSIEIRGYANADAIDACEVLFVGREAESELAAIIQRTAGKPTLLIGDTPGYAGRGVAIEFFTKPDVFRKRERLRFRIDPGALEHRGLVVSAQLMDVAEVLP